MAGSIDHVLQPDGTYKWEVVEPKTEAQKVAKVCSTPKPQKQERLEVQKETVAKFEKMTKAELETYGRTIGLELDRRENKADLIVQLQKFTSAS